MRKSSKIILSSKYPKVKGFHESPYNQFVEFSDWFRERYTEWRGDKVGREGSKKAFADYLDVPPQSVSDWMKPGGKKPDTAKSILKLADKLGGGVYDYVDIDPLDFTPSDDQLRPIAEMIRLFPERQRPAVRQAVEDSLAAAIHENIPPEQIGRDMLRRLQAILDQERVSTE